MGAVANQVAVFLYLFLMPVFYSYFKNIAYLNVSPIFSVGSSKTMIGEKLFQSNLNQKLNIMRTDQEKYCFNCGAVIDSKAAICPKCGVPQPDVVKNNSISNRWLATFLLCVLLGVFGAHRFYLGRTGTGILMLITFGGFGIWYLIDLILVIVGQMRDSNGNFVKAQLE
jgi:TM2 domain-containing membrane protein YozV